MSRECIEDTIGKVAEYIRHGQALDGLADSERLIWQVSELASKAGTDPRMLGKVRLHFKRALAQALTPGENPRFAAFAENCYGKTAIAIGRKL